MEDVTGSTSRVRGGVTRVPSVRCPGPYRAGGSPPPTPRPLWNSRSTHSTSVIWAYNMSSLHVRWPRLSSSNSANRRRCDSRRGWSRFAGSTSHFCIVRDRRSTVIISTLPRRSGSTSCRTPVPSHPVKPGRSLGIPVDTEVLHRPLTPPHPHAESWWVATFRPTSHVNRVQGKTSGPVKGRVEGRRERADEKLRVRGRQSRPEGCHQVSVLLTGPLVLRSPRCRLLP